MAPGPGTVSPVAEPESPAASERDATGTPEPEVADGTAQAGALSPLPALELRDGLPDLTDTQAGLAEAAARIAGGTGPIAIDAERASGYRYGQRAYLVQVRREGSGTFLIDPIPLEDPSPLARALSGPEWILHAASQDLPCLAELGLAPTTLFDTELAGRLLGMERVGLAPMVEQVLGRTLAKGHGAADWSTRPLPDAWREYAALDVEVLIELREHLRAELESAGKWEWARQEFAAVREAPPAVPRADPWRRTSGIHRIRSRRGLAMVKHLWLERERVARTSDVAPGRVLPDSAIVAVAQALPRDGTRLSSVAGFHGRGAARHARDWAEAIRAAWELSEEELPVAGAGVDGPPPPRSWAQRDPAAAARLDRARAALSHLAAQLRLPVENLLSPDLVRRIMWQPPDAGFVAAALAAGGARSWQVELTADLLEAAIRPAASQG